MNPTHCKHHGIKLIEKTLNETKKTSLLLRFALWITNSSKYTQYGAEKTYLVCPKGDFATES